MWFWPVNEMTELVSGMPEPQFGRTNLRECEDQTWFKVQAVPVFRFVNVRCFRVPQVEAHRRIKAEGNNEEFRSACQTDTSRAS
jgi:hypothetical protein